MKSRKQTLLHTCVIALLYTCMLVVMGCTPWVQEKELWEYWKQSDEYNQNRINYEFWEYILNKYVVKRNDGLQVVKYASFTREDRIALQQYLRQLSHYPITSYSRNAQLAYWLNLYNAQTIYMVVRNYPIKSVKKLNISPGTFNGGPWDKKAFIIEGNAVSLNNIQHNILRPIFGDDKIFYGLNNGSISAALLQDKPFTAQNVETMLDRMRETFISESAGVQITEKGDLKLSSMYKWFLYDFASDEATLLDYLRKYAKGSRKSQLEEFNLEKNKIIYSYNWKLNDLER